MSYIEGLKAAYAAAPSTRLRMVLAEALYDAEETRAAYDLLAPPFTDAELTEADRLLAGRIAVDAEEAEDALQWCPGETPAQNLIRAKAYLALQQPEKGLQAYSAAVRANHTLEDRGLERALQSSAPPVAADARVVPLRLVSAQDNREAEEEAFAEAPESAHVTFREVGGLAEVKKQIHRRIILPFQKPGLLQSFRKKAGGGVLLYGPPGCGKTLLARATAGECSAKFFNIAVSDVMDMYMGESERKLAALFEQARRLKPSVLFFDELEALATKRDYGAGGHASRVISQFLSEMDGFTQGNDGVLVLGATNVPWAIDPAFRRPGRFDRVLFVPPPDREARAEILRMELAGRPQDGSVQIEPLVARTSGYSGADLRNLVDTACDYAIEASLDQGREQPLSMAMLTEALREVRPTTLEWLSSVKNYARYANEGGQYDEVMEFLKAHGSKA